MAKRITYIVFGALLVFGLLFLLWSFFFNENNPDNQNGSFGTASTTQGGLGTGGDQTGNGQIPIGSNTGSGGVNGSIPIGGTTGTNSGTTNTGTGVNSGTGGGVQISGTSTFSTSVPGVQWLGSNRSTLNAGNGFNPIPINGINGASIGGTVSIVGGGINGGSTGGSLDFTTALIGAAGTGAAVCGAKAALASYGAGTTGAAGASSAAVGVPVGGPVLAFIAGNQGVQTGLKVGDAQNNFASCIINVLAKAALTQITASIVNWINSGFNGQPTFVTNYQQFFTNIADQAAGEFIKGSGLAFLCSAFKPQIRIAIAQSYANRGAQSCTLSKVINNVNNFMNGAFSQGGWQGFVSFTTMPLNNPYGSYAYAQLSLGNTIANKQLEQATGLQLGQGFLNVTKKVNGKDVIVTPGSTVAKAVSETLAIPQQQLALANSFDQIINALMNQLTTRSLQNGLTNLNGNSSYQTTQTPEQAAAQQQAQSMLADMQSKVTFAQQYGSIQQGSIRDIQQVQVNVNSLANCWGIAASSTSLTATQQAQAATNAQNANTTLTSLDARIAPYNNTITGVNSLIALLVEFQTQALSVASVADVQTLTQAYTAAQTTTQFITQADVTTAQQNRTTLQAEMSTLNQQTQTGLAQCQAFGH